MLLECLISSYLNSAHGSHALPKPTEPIRPAASSNLNIFIQINSYNLTRIRQIQENLQKKLKREKKIIKFLAFESRKQVQKAYNSNQIKATFLRNEIPLKRSVDFIIFCFLFLLLFVVVVVYFGLGFYHLVLD